MRMRRPLTPATFGGIFLIVLLLQTSIIIPRTHWDCRCGELYPHTSMCSCQCPRCVKEQSAPAAASCCTGESMPMCRHEAGDTKETAPVRHGKSVKPGNQAHRDETAGTFLKGVCGCGASWTTFSLPGDSPFIRTAGMTGPLPRKLPDPLFSYSRLYTDASICIHTRPG